MSGDGEYKTREGNKPAVLRRLRAPGNVKITARRHKNMRTTKTYSDWTESDLNFLAANYGKLPYKTLGAVIGKTAKSVKNKANTVGLTKLNDPTLTADLEPGFCHAQDAALLAGRSVPTILGWCRAGKLPGAKKIMTLTSTMWAIPLVEIEKLTPGRPKAKTKVRTDTTPTAIDPRLAPTRTLVLCVPASFLDEIFLRDFSSPMPAAATLDEVVIRVSR